MKQVSNGAVQNPPRSMSDTRPSFSPLSRSGSSCADSLDRKQPVKEDEGWGKGDGGRTGGTRCCLGVCTAWCVGGLKLAVQLLCSENNTKLDQKVEGMVFASWKILECGDWTFRSFLHRNNLLMDVVNNRHVLSWRVSTSWKVAQVPSWVSSSMLILRTILSNMKSGYATTYSTPLIVARNHCGHNLAWS